MASTIQVDKITDIGGNTMLESNGSGTFTSSLPAPTSGIAASAIDSGTIATARLGSGTASASTFLRGDQTYATVGGIDCDADAWMRVTPVTDQNAAAVVDFSSSIHMGSNISESGGRVTVATAGWYRITFQFSNMSANADNMNVYLRKNTVRQLGSIYWEGNTEINYLGMTASVLCEAAANDIFDIYGSGYWAGNTNNQSTTYFTGVRLGA